MSRFTIRRRALALVVALHVAGTATVQAQDLDEKLAELREKYGAPPKYHPLHVGRPTGDVLRRSHLPEDPRLRLVEGPI